MNCPKCGTQNPDDAKFCTSCSAELKQSAKPAESVKVRTSRIAIAVLVIGILTVFVFFLAVILKSDILAIIYFCLVISALVIAIVSFVLIGLSAGKLSGLGFAVIGIIIAVVPALSVFVHAVFLGPRMVAYRMVCGSNLSGLGRAMLIYANDYDNNYPRAGGPDTIWQPRINNWKADNRIDAFGLKPDGTGGSATISSSLFLLVKYAETTPKSFVCPSDRKTKPFKASDYGALMYDEDAWDFGPESTKHCSFSYHTPYGPYPLNTTCDPNLAVAADRNPWMDPYTDTTGFKWDGKTMTRGRENIRGYQKGNSGLHKREGQNVLFMDNHAYFEKVSFCGVNDDNIYTFWDGSDIQQGAPPVIGSRPADRLDSLLVNEPPTRDQK